MTGGALGDLLPLALVIALSPIPIVACILMLFSGRGRVNGPAFLVGWVVGITAVTLVVRLVSGSTGATDDPASGGASLGDLLLLVLGLGAILLGIKQWRGRPKPGEDVPLPTWMSTIDQFTPGKAFGFGIVLSAVNPKNLTMAIAAGVVMSQAIAVGADPLALEVLFVVLASSSIGVLVLYALLGGDGATRTMDGWRTWLTANNVAIMAVLFIVIGAKLLGTGLDAVLG